MGSKRMWSPPYEAMPREELQQLQWERLQATLNRVYRHVTYYRRCFDQIGLLPEDLETIDDLQRLPFTTRETLMENYPYGMFAVPLREVVRIHSIPGWTGRPIVVGYTRNDLDHWSELTARVLHSCGVNQEDVVQVSFGYGMLNRGLGLHYGAERIGASVIPGSTEEVKKQILIMRDFRTTVLVASPSFALYVLEIFQEMGMDPKGLCLRVGVFGGEPWAEFMRDKIEQGLLLDGFDHYVVAEALGPGIAGECTEKNGMHIAEDHFIAEIVHPETGKPLPQGKEGELVLTSINREAFPLLRFRTGDITTLFQEPCPCGRTLTRMARLRRRADDIVVVNGMPVSISRIRDILKEVEGTEPLFQIIVERDQGEDHLEVKLEVRGTLFEDEMKKLEARRTALMERLRDVFRIKVCLTLADPRSLRNSLKEGGVLVDKRINSE
jgi:phenylacetate-CoA ligase